MRKACLLYAAALVPALTGAQRQQRALSYHGWALGISLDSAGTLARGQIGKPLVCVGMDSKTMFCQTNRGSGYASLYFSPVPRRLEEMTLQIPLDRRASRDSIEKWFAARWGTPIPREVIRTESTPAGRGKPTTDVIGSWATDGGTVIAMAGFSSLDDTTYSLGVSILKPARQIRLMQERASRNRKAR
jgi:hypothetical protein